MEVRSVEAIFSALNEAQVRYLVVGGLAVNAHGYERLTRDVDLVINLQPDNIVRGLRALMGIGYQMTIPETPERFADAALREHWRATKNMIVLKLWSEAHVRTPIDVFVYEPFNFDEELKRATWEPVIGNVLAPVLACSSLVKMKYEAGRDKDLLDIQALAKIEPYRK